MQLKDLPVGSLVKDPNTNYVGYPLIFRILEHGHAGDPARSTTLQTRDVIAMKAFDAKEPNNPNSYISQYGNNRYLYSNILQWLNSDKAAEEWYTAQYEYDAPPISDNIYGGDIYAAEAGFLTNLSQNFKKILLNTSKIVGIPAQIPITYETVETKFFLLSVAETGVTIANCWLQEGILYDYYSGDNLENKIKKYFISNQSAVKDWWLRSPMQRNYSTSNYQSFYISPSNSAYWGYNTAVRSGNTIGIAPACCIPQNTFVSDQPDENGIYSFIFIDPCNHYYIGNENNKAIEYKPQTVMTLSGENIQFKIDENGNYCYKKQDDENFYPLNIITSPVDLGAGSPLPTGSLLVVYNE